MLQKKSRNLTLDKLKSTFREQSLVESKAKITAIGIDGKEVELDEGEDDQEYNPDEAQKPE